MTSSLSQIRSLFQRCGQRFRHKSYPVFVPSQVVESLALPEASSEHCRAVSHAITVLLLWIARSGNLAGNAVIHTAPGTQDLIEDESELAARKGSGSNVYFVVYCHERIHQSTYMSSQSRMYPLTRVDVQHDQKMRPPIGDRRYQQSAYAGKNRRYHPTFLRCTNRVHPSRGYSWIAVRGKNGESREG